MEWSEVVAQIGGLAHLATSSPAGDPHVSQVAPFPHEGLLWIFTRSTSGKARRVRANPKVALMWSPGAEVYVYGTAEIVTDLPTKQQMWYSGLPSYDPAAFFGEPENATVVLVRIQPDRALVIAHDGEGLQMRRWTR